MTTLAVREETAILDSGELAFSIESRILRELGERLVKHPETALLELIKNAYDADAEVCTITLGPEEITVDDWGHGMTLDEFKGGWMRIGTSAKEAHSLSRHYSRAITGEKGIGRFAVRFLGRVLELESIADDPSLGRTRLRATFDWPTIDRTEDLGQVRVPYVLQKADPAAKTGTKLAISALRIDTASIDRRKRRTGSVGVETPLRSLLSSTPLTRGTRRRRTRDPGFTLRIEPAPSDDEGSRRRRGFYTRGVCHTGGGRAEGRPSPDRDLPARPARAYLEITDKCRTRSAQPTPTFGFCLDEGTFTDLNLDGRLASTWLLERLRCRRFRSHFPGLSLWHWRRSDDWLTLSTDGPLISRPALEHHPATSRWTRKRRAAPSENYMLRLPQATQVVGVVQVEGQEGRQQAGGSAGRPRSRSSMTSYAAHRLCRRPRGLERLASIREETRSAHQCHRSRPVDPIRDGARS